MFVALSLFWAVALIVGGYIPIAFVLAAFHRVYGQAFDPAAPAVVGEVLRYALAGGLAVVVLGKMGLARYGYMLAYFLAGLFVCGAIAAAVFSNIVALVLHAIVSPLFGINARREWWPAVHAFFYAVGVSWAAQIVWSARRDLLAAGDGRYDVGGYRRRPWSTGAAAAASAGSGDGYGSTSVGDSGHSFGGSDSWSGGGAGGSWGDGSDGDGDNGSDGGSSD